MMNHHAAFGRFFRASTIKFPQNRRDQRLAENFTGDDVSLFDDGGNAIQAELNERHLDTARVKVGGFDENLSARIDADVKQTVQITENQRARTATIFSDGDEALTGNFFANADFIKRKVAHEVGGRLSGENLSRVLVEQFKLTKNFTEHVAILGLHVVVEPLDAIIEFQKIVAQNFVAD